MKTTIILFIGLGLGLQLVSAQAGGAGALRAGAAKVDITPPESALSPGDSIRDHLYARAILIDNGKTCAALVGIDQNGASTKLTESVIARTTQTIGCPAANYIIAGTVVHSAATSGIDRGLPSETQVTDAIVSALGTAKSRLQPARIGYGTINLDLNVNRDAYEKGMWFEAPNLSGPSDKTLAVVSLIGTNGMPIGVYMNYRMHPINFYQSGVLSGDYPGDAERWVERRFDDKPVAIFSQGSPGDQDMMALDLYFKLLGIRAGLPEFYEQRVDGAPPSEVMAAMRKSSNTINEGLKKPVPEKNMAAYKEAVAQTSQLVATYGTMIGESSIVAMKYRTANRTDTAEIAGAQETVTCPGRVRLDNTARENVLPPYKDGDPVNLKVGVLRIGDINLATVDADLYSEIGMRLKREAPASQTILITPANGMATPGHLYVYSDAAGSHLTFQVIGSRLKPGCAEGKIIDTVIGLMHK